jgi:hypothetical protein
MVSGVIADTLVQIARILTHFAKLGTAMQQLAGRFPTLAGSLDDAGKAVSDFGTKRYLESGYKNIAYNRKALDQQEATTADRGLRVRPWGIRLAQDPMA